MTQTDIEEAAKAKEPKPAKAKKVKPALLASNLKAPTQPLKPAKAGHNSLTVPGVISLMEEAEASKARVKAETKIQGDISARAKTEYGISKKAWNEEIALRKLDRDTRIQHESMKHDLKGMLGYQASLDLKPGTVARTEEEHENPSLAADKLINRSA